MNKKMLFLIICLGIIAIVGISAALFSAKNPNISVPLLPTPTAIQPAASQQKLVPQFTEGSTQKLADKMKNRIFLSDADQKIKNKLLTPLNNASGVVYKSADFEVDYIKAPDIFQIQSFIRAMDKTKQESIAWLTSQGFSQTGICNLPVMFLFAQPLANQLRSEGFQFNPLPDGC